MNFRNERDLVGHRLSGKENNIHINFLQEHNNESDPIEGEESHSIESVAILSSN